MSATTKSATTKSATTLGRTAGPSGHHQAGAYSAVGEQVLLAVIGAPSGACYEVLSKLAFACRKLSEAVSDARKRAASRIIRGLSVKPDFEAGYGPELTKLKPLIPRDNYTELEELLADNDGASFYVWALLRLAHAHLTCTVAPLTLQTYDDFTDALFPLVGDDCSEADGIIGFFLDETGLLRYATADQREDMEWVLRPDSFARQYNDARGAVPPFVRVLEQLAASAPRVSA